MKEGRDAQQPASLLADLPRGDPAKKPEEYRPPEAAFASPDEIVRHSGLSYRPGALFLGLIGAYPVGISDDRHIITIAGSRAGKGRCVIVPNMLLYPGSVLASDPKGELATITARRRCELGQAVHVLDPFGVALGNAERFRAAFNPVAAIRPASLVGDAALIADALVIVDDPHWDESARSLIEGVILHTATDAAYEGLRNLVTVRNLIAGHQKPLPALQKEMQRNDAAGGAVQAAAADFFDRPDRERDSVLSTARRHLKFIALPEIQAVLSSHSFDLAALKTGTVTVYLCLPARHMGTCSRWLRLFVNLALQEMERTPGRPALPVLFILDEFATLGHMRQIEDAAGQIAGFGVKLWPVLQDLGQLKALYQDRWETFMGNAGVLQFFGNNDLTTLEWMSKRCDRTSIRSRHDSAVPYQQRQSGATGASWGTEVHDLITPGEAALYFGRSDPLMRQLVIWAGQPPLVLQRTYYDRNPLFAQLFDPQP